MIAGVKKGFDAKMHWLDQPDTMPLSLEAKEFARFVMRAFNLRAENLDVSEYQKIVNNKNFLDEISGRIGERDQLALDHYSRIDDSSLKFYIEHSVLCLTGRFEAFSRLQNK